MTYSKEQPIQNACESCGFLNPPSESYCQACNFTLDCPASHDGLGRYRAIESHVQALRDGDMSIEDFRLWAEEMHAAITEEGQAICRFFDETRYYHDNAAEVEIGVEGMRGYEAGVEELWRFTQDYDADHLDTGLALILEGNDRILEAMRINRESRDQLENEWISLRAAREELDYGYYQLECA